MSQAESVINSESIKYEMGLVSNKSAMLFCFN